ncbi:cupin-like domain-containing protein [bacterium]|nr:cupin-like domain-containing protein [bacterium]
MNNKPLRIVEHLDYDEFVRDHLKTNTPVIIKGAVSHWPAISKWNIDYLKDTIGNNTFSLKRHYAGDKEWHMNEFFADIESGKSDRYLTNGNIADFFPQLIKDLEPYSPYGLPDWKCNHFLPDTMHYDNYQVELLAGNAGTGFFLHYDRGHINAFVAQIVGQKRVALLPPSSSQYLDPTKNVSKVDIWSLLENNDPLLEKLNAKFYTLEPGDMVFTPSDWWHTTKNESLSFGVTFNSVHQYNWSAFSKYVSESKAERSGKLKSLALRMFLFTIGGCNVLKEMIGGTKQSQKGLEKAWSQRYQPPQSHSDKTQ